MKRRQFFKETSATLIALQWQSCQQSRPLMPGSAIDLEEVTIDTIQDRLQNNTLSIEELIGAYVQRIKEIDVQGPALNSIIHMNNKAMSIARALDKELAEGKSRGPLHGIPVLLKDNIDTGDMPTTAGSRALEGSIPPDDSHLVGLLKEAGAVILGKANLSEWANFRGEPSTSGWSGLAGLTKNPYILDRNTCGSSAGSGAAVAASLCVIAIGTETNGSIVCPSQTCGIVGIKPTVGLVSRDGIIPISSTQDTAGPMARTVRDAAICLTAMAGRDSSDPKTLQEAATFGIDYSRFLNRDGLAGKRLGVYHSSRGNHPRVDRVFDKALEDLERGGAELIELDAIMDSSVRRHSFTVMLYEYKAGLNDYFQSLGPDAKIRSLKELIEFNEQDEIELNYHDQVYLKNALEKGSLESKEYKDSLSKAMQGSRAEGIDKVMAEHQLDGIVSPSGGPAWKTDLTNGDHFSLGSSSPAAISGYPNITVPMGFVDHLPIGISIYGKAWSEAQLIELAYAYEQMTQHRQSPKYLRS